ncbi:MAG TPA: thermonuclease family protein [Casimicrobiaceae bacterium]|nr:thermonuclease family protein [Casimicrobiaceae bacterium]
MVFGLCVVSSAIADFAGRVVAVHDGDTITVLSAGRPIRVRLAGIDAPEAGQPFSNASRHALEALVAARDVMVIERGRDGYGRVLARVHAGSIDVNAEQVRLGYAWVYRRFERDARLHALEVEAKAARRGLWRDPRASPPWVWRERRALQPARLEQENAIPS